MCAYIVVATICQFDRHVARAHHHQEQYTIAYSERVRIRADSCIDSWYIYQDALSVDLDKRNIAEAVEVVRLLWKMGADTGARGSFTLQQQLFFADA